MGEAKSPGRWIGGRRSVFLLLPLLAFSAWLNLWNNDFPLGYHPDESKKVRSLLRGAPDFHHPVLMLDVVGLAVAATGAESDFEVVRVGRAVSGLFGALLVFVFFLLVRRLLDPLWVWVATLAVACSPILVVHAHYLKEDMFFVPFAIAFLVALFAWLERPAWPRALLLGALLGLALGAQYKGSLLLVVLLASPIFVPRVRTRSHAGAMLGIVLLAGAVFLLVNYPLFGADSRFEEGLGAQIEHAQSGHRIVIRALDHAFSFHFLRSLLPGLTSVVAWAGLLGIAAAVLSWRRLDWRHQLLLVYVAATYFAHEITPLKPYPDFMRYMIPTAPLWIYFAVWAVARLESALPRRWGHAAARALGVLVVAVPLQSSIRLDYHLTRDTRTRVEHFISQPDVFLGHYTTAGHRRSSRRLFTSGLDQIRPRLVVVSSFAYERFEYGATLENQPGQVRRGSRHFALLFRQPYQEIQPAYRSFAFSNPTLRIVDFSAEAWKSSR